MNNITYEKFAADEFTTQKSSIIENEVKIQEHCRWIKYNGKEYFSTDVIIGIYTYLLML